ncbi:MAG: hypothetical protein IKH86_03065 [Prevotella sp.]|nr:hypothetical protein [Prevotella sp.]
MIKKILEYALIVVMLPAALCIRLAGRILFGSNPVFPDEDKDWFIYDDW